ncbi:MAG: hypothetical protein HQL01_05615 [Nitrospirae bacterium]|nr:hypothetical protein [Nitrospirota bacterium]
MPTVVQLRDRLIEKLRELFQLNQPDLDFGFYRIMHAKAKQVSDFLDNDLLKTVEGAFGRDTANAEGEIYDHLYRFFERYYHDGDFISRRYYTRETPGKAAPFAIPYNGEEVKLHWANADQYYIKTTEHFNNFTVDLRQARELQVKEGHLNFDADTTPLRVHFHIVAATE